jgi:hypothetical protein
LGDPKGTQWTLRSSWTEAFWECDPPLYWLNHRIGAHDETQTSSKRHTSNIFKCWFQVKFSSSAPVLTSQAKHFFLSQC